MKLFSRRSSVGLKTLIFVLISLTLMFVDQRFSYLQTLRATLMSAMSPLQFFVDAPIRIATSVKDNFISQQHLLEENARLRAQLLLLSAQMQTLLKLEKENSRLLQLLDSSRYAALDKVLVARVLAVSSAPFIHQILINQGSAQGVFLGQPVLASNGILGQVIEAGSRVSRVMLLTSPLSAIPVSDSRNGIRGIVHGVAKSEQLNLLYVAKSADVAVGDKLVSSGLGLRYPAGYPVGQVSHVDHEQGHLFSAITVKPAADTLNSNLVLLVWPTPAANELRQVAKQQLTALNQPPKKGGR